MIDFYTAATPNGRKVAIMLEELGVSYTEHKVDLGKLEQKSPDFLSMNPNGKIPVIIDHEGPFNKKTTVFESAAILYYLAEKHGGRFFGHSLDEKAHVMQWTMFQMSAIGPILGNYYYGMNTLTPKNPGFIQRFEKEATRLLGVMETQLHKNEYLAGKNYSIADIATYPWIANFIKLQPAWFESKPSIRRWAQMVGSRPAVKKVML
ncbi:glutathione S-transferase N-terminal domain-containing protein [Bdellovibrio sp. 22V]|uniref:glutathione S-transferase family protein n=1 Tax=Bdellovibrio TaxID=958 RepID=UPI002542A98F|nr:glutathione S-transferase N-terminal domain-containing protein [Bdellovibrio sp. 22V]WII71088.1 glutathione S-transferase N-terminal domain-containing protein [Bdellovibrio sp. 22V]